MVTMNSRRSWMMFRVAIAAYLVAVLQRSSLGVAAVEATDRFDVNAAALSTLGVVQIVVYAALQIPVGVMLDRVGPRALLATGAALMALGQATLALAPTLEIALVARVLVGAGDAMVAGFLSATAEGEAPSGAFARAVACAAASVAGDIAGYTGCLPKVVLQPLEETPDGL